MPQGSPQFTPRQLLDAGRRAEAEGKLDHANQLYRHLTDHYAYTTEATEARNGLGRLGAGAGQQLWAENGAAASASPDSALFAHGRTPRHPFRRQRPAGGEERNYRTGRVLATLVSWVGWLIVAAGAAMVPLVLVTDPQMLSTRLALCHVPGARRGRRGGGRLLDRRPRRRVLGADGERAVRPGQRHTRAGRHRARQGRDEQALSRMAQSTPCGDAPPGAA